MKYLTEIEELKNEAFPRNYVNKKPHSNFFYSFERVRDPLTIYGWDIDTPLWDIKKLLDIDSWTQETIGYVKHDTREKYAVAVINRGGRGYIEIKALEAYEAFEKAVNKYIDRGEPNNVD